MKDFSGNILVLVQKGIKDCVRTLGIPSTQMPLTSQVQGWDLVPGHRNCVRILVWVHWCPVKKVKKVWSHWCPVRIHSYSGAQCDPSKHPLFFLCLRKISCQQSMTGKTSTWTFLLFVQESRICRPIHPRTCRWKILLSDLVWTKN